MMNEKCPCGKPKESCPIYSPAKVLCSGEIYPYCDYYKHYYADLIHSKEDKSAIISGKISPEEI